MVEWPSIHTSPKLPGSMDSAEMLPHAPDDLANEINLKKIALDAKHTANQELRPEKKYGGNTSWTCAHAIIYITCTGTKIETINPFIILVHISCTLCVTSMIFALSTQRHQIQYLISGEGLPDPRPAA